MKICMLGNAQSIHVQRWANYFIQRGKNVFLLSPLKADQESNINFYYLKPSSLSMRYIPVLFEEISYPLQTAHIIRHIKPDILHAFYAEFYGWLGALSGFHPFIISVFGGDVKLDPQKGRFIKSKIAFGLNHADMITAQNHTLIKFMNREFKIPTGKMLHVPWGVDMNLFYKGYAGEVNRLRQKLDIPQKACVVLSPRQMHPLYQIDLIVHAIPMVLKKHPETFFVFLSSLDQADDGHYHRQVRDLAQQLNVTGHTRFLKNPVSPTDMPVYLNMAEVSVSIPQMDQFGLTVLEAMACGSIPIVSNLECYREYLKDGHNAFFVKEAQPIQIANCINTCLGDRSLHGKFYEMNREIVRSSENWHHKSLL